MTVIGRRTAALALAGPLLVLLVLLGAGCTGGDGGTVASNESTPNGDAASGEDDAGDGEETDAGSAEPAGAAVASAEFVSVALDGGDGAADHLAEPTAETLTGRLSQLQSLATTIEAVRPSTTAYPEASDGPACDRAPDLFCQVDLVASGDAVMASVVVHWASDGVTDFSIVTRAPDGSPTGIGETTCSTGYRVLHGGQITDRFDIAVCTNNSGNTEYTGDRPGTTENIRITACQAGERQWEAINDGHRYLVDGSSADSTGESRLTVEDPDGVLLVDEAFRPVSFTPPTEPGACS